MARMKKEDVVMRENYVLDLLKVNPTMPILQVNESLKAKYRRMMRPNRIQELRASLAEAKMPTSVADGL